MTSSTQAYTAVLNGARNAAENTAQAFKQGTQSVAGQADALVSRLPEVDLKAPVEQYFDFLQQFIDVNREVALRWAQLVGELSGAVREQTQSVWSLATEQAAKAADVAVEPARRAEEVANQQAARVEEAEREQARAARRAERERARQAQEKARAKYEDLTKAELSDRLAERGLPKTGTVEELVERLVEADQK